MQRINPARSLSPGVLAFLLLWAVVGAVPVGGQPVREPLVFATVADLHVTDVDSMKEFKAAIAQINEVIKPAFVYIAGDTPDGGTAEQYRLYKAVRDTIQCPVYDVAGDHEARAGGLEHYRKTLGDPTYSFSLGQYRFIGLNSMAMDQAQIDWAKRELAVARNGHQIPVAFIHHDLAGMKDKATVGQLDKVLNEGGVKLVLAGHTHNNIVINNGSRLDITTTSIKTPKGKDGAGYAIVTLDAGRIAWHFVPLAQKTIVAICNPVSKLMATGPEAVVKGKCRVRAKAYDPSGIKSVVATVAGGQGVELTRDASDTWSGDLDCERLKDGEATLKVTAIAVSGQSGTEEITILVSQRGAYAATPQTVSDGGAGKGGPGKDDGKKGPKGGPNRESVTMDQLPAAVRDTIRTHAGDVALNKLEKETKDGTQSYKADWDVKGRKYELRVGADGGTIEQRQDVEVADLPQTVAAAAKKSLGDLKQAECKKILQLQAGKMTERYEVRSDLDGTRRHIVVSLDGTVETKGPKGDPKGPKKNPK